MIDAGRGSKRGRGRKGGGAAIPILMYHHVTGRIHSRYRDYSVAPATFAAQMRWLSAVGYSTISLDDLLAHRASGEALPGKPIIITFDDGFQETVDAVVPVLQDHGFRATFFIVAGLMGLRSRWLQAEIGCDFSLLSWETARWLVSNGFPCESHSLTHPRLAELGEAECFQEMSESRERLEDGLGSEIRHLAYPYGSYSPGVRRLAAQAGYMSGCTVKQGLTTDLDDALELRRIWVPIAEPESLPGFVFRVHTSRTPGEWLQRKRTAALRRLGGRG